jgi:hypothetical protein
MGAVAGVRIWAENPLALCHANQGLATSQPEWFGLHAALIVFI